jgi:hypothetical protein
VLVIALLGGLLAWHGGLGRNSARTPRLDPASQRYVTMLWTYYVPLVAANDKAQTCLARMNYSDPAMQAQLMPTCQTLETTELAAAQTFSAQLNAATPPARWRAQHAALQAAGSYLIAVTNEQVAAITARDVTRYLGTIEPALTAQSRFEDPITQLNLQLHVGAPPRPRPLPYLSSNYATASVIKRTTSPAALDPASQAYVDLLRAYYVPLEAAYPPAFQCYLDVTGSQTAVDITICQAPIQAELAAAQALSIHLASATPPAQWQTVHATLRQDTQLIITVLTERLQAISANSLTQLLAASPPSGSKETVMCDPIARINEGLPALSPPLPSFEAELCYV